MRHCRRWTECRCCSARLDLAETPPLTPYWGPMAPMVWPCTAMTSRLMNNSRFEVQSSMSNRMLLRSCSLVLDQVRQARPATWAKLIVCVIISCAGACGVEPTAPDAPDHAAPDDELTPPGGGMAGAPSFGIAGDR